VVGGRGVGQKKFRENRTSQITWFRMKERKGIRVESRSGVPKKIATKGKRDLRHCARKLKARGQMTIGRGRKLLGEGGGTTHEVRKVLLIERKSIEKYRQKRVSGKGLTRRKKKLRKNWTEDSHGSGGQKKKIGKRGDGPVTKGSPSEGAIDQREFS